ncbi:MAG: hypothetical protein Tsb0020_54400 [Haliangiales bacterium]
MGAGQGGGAGANGGVMRWGAIRLCLVLWWIVAVLKLPLDAAADALKTAIRRLRRGR